MAQGAARSPEARTVATDRCPAAFTIPAYGWKLTDEEIAERLGSRDGGPGQIPCAVNCKLERARRRTG